MSNSPRVRYGRIIGMLVALAAFFALPAVALAQDETVASGNTQDAEIEQSGEASGGGSVGNQAAIVQQNAGEDAVANINQSQSFGGGTVVHGDDFDDNGHVRHHGGGAVTGHVSGGGGVGGGVTLARTGFEAWMLGLAGGVLLVGGLALLAAQRRGRLES